MLQSKETQLCNARICHGQYTKIFRTKLELGLWGPEMANRPHESLGLFHSEIKRRAPSHLHQDRSLSHSIKRVASPQPESLGRPRDLSRSNRARREFKTFSKKLTSTSLLFLPKSLISSKSGKCRARNSFTCRESKLYPARNAFNHFQLRPL